MISGLKDISNLHAVCMGMVECPPDGGHNGIWGPEAASGAG